MAKQKGIIKLEGTIGDITFLKTQDGYLAKEKSGVPASRIATDPAFARTRENGAEFGRAGKGAKLIKSAFRTTLQNTRDNRMGSRLHKELVTVLQSDQVSDRGARTIEGGQLSFLQGFEFNGNAQLTSTIFAPYTATIDRATGDLSVSIPSFIPINEVVAPQGATHFKIRSAAGELDFSNGVSITDSKESAYLPVDSTATAAMNLVNNVTANSTLPLVLLLGIEFTQQVNGSYYSLKNGAFNAMAIVKVDA